MFSKKSLLRSIMILILIVYSMTSVIPGTTAESDREKIDSRYKELAVNNNPEDFTVYTGEQAENVLSERLSAEEKEAISDLARGLEERWLLEQKLPGNMDHNQTVNALKKLVNVELRQMEKYQEAHFDDPLLEMLIHSYVHALLNQKKGIEELYETELFDRYWTNEGSHICQLCVYMINGLYQIPVHEEYRKSMEEYIIAGYLLMPDDPVGYLLSVLDVETEASDEGDTNEEESTSAQAETEYQKADNLYNDGKYAEALQSFLKAAEIGSSMAYYRAAKMYSVGEGTPVDYSKAFEYAQKGAELSNGYAVNLIGYMYEKGMGVKKDEELAHQYYEKAAELDCPIGFYNLASDSYNKGQYSDALEYYIKAAELEYDPVYSYLASMYYNGEGTNVDYSKAMEYARKGMESGDGYATNILGILFMNGYGVSQDEDLARQYYQQAGESGCPYGYYNLAYALYYKGQYDNAIEFFEKAGEMNYAAAWNQLGWMYRYGIGVQKNYDKAKEYYEKAGILGDASAICSIGTLYYYGGQNVKKSLKTAREYYEKAAEMGSTDALISIGQLYERGEGVKKDLQKAMEFYQQAADQGSADGWFALGSYYDVKKDYDNSVMCYEKTIELGGEDAYGAQVYMALGYVYSMKKYAGYDLDKAIEYYEKSNELGGDWENKKYNEAAINKLKKQRDKENKQSTGKINKQSIMNNNIIIELISACPSIGKASKSTKEFYSSDDDYKRDYPKTDKIHTWRISIQKGLILFGDEFNTTILMVVPNGTPAQLIPVIKWEIQLLEKIPEISKQAEKNGYTMIAEKRVDGGDYAQYADSNGIIDLLNDGKYTGVLEQMHSNLGLLELVDSFSALGDLDTNGNGQIDYEEIFGD